MKTASLKDIKTELENLTSAELIALCLRLGRFRKENKEMLTYLLFEAYDEQAYANNLKNEIDEQFAAINTGSSYFIKKSLRKILRMITKHARYTGSAAVEVQLLLHFCSAFRSGGSVYRESQVLINLYRAQVKKIEKGVKGMHEDLQYDYLREIEPL